jgi:hypothetical protein
MIRTARAALAAAVFACALAPTAAAQAPYNDSAGKDAPAPAPRTVEEVQSDGSIKRKTVFVPVERDQHGNAKGTSNDLAVDGAFKGQTVAVLHFYTGEGFDFSLPKAALEQKGFSTYRWVGAAPPAKELEQKLEKANQLWVISDCSRSHLTPEHVAVIQRYFDQGHGVYIWGDNEPCYGDANILGKAILDVQMKGNLQGDKPVGVQKNGKGPGVRKDHLITTGVETVYEGITVATVDDNTVLTPILYGSAGNLITAAYEKNGKRAIFDGGFTRLYYAWNTAGTERYVKNAAAWLANYERFGDKVTASVDAKKP